MPQTRIPCPRCRQPIVATVEQVFDVNADPQARQRFLSGAVNVVQCPNCGYQGPVPTPLVYHDPQKELLLTYFPPEMGLPMIEQERYLGPIINQVVSRLPAEKRKGYLLRPQSMLTMQGMVERVLEAEGITRDMIQAQQQRLNLLQRLMAASPESRLEIAKAEDALIDDSFFSMLSRLMEAAISSQDEQAARQMVELQQMLLANTTRGKVLKDQIEETEAGIRTLQEASKKGLTRESLLDILANATETQLATLVGLVRNGLDYQFFQILTERIQRSQGEEKAKLEKLRDLLLEMTREIDEEVQEQSKQAKKMLEEILNAKNVEEATVQNLPAINQLFVDVLRNELQNARQKGNLERSSKLQTVMSTLEKASTPPPEYELIEELMGAEDEKARRVILEQHSQEITPEFLQLLSGLIAQSEGQGQDLDVLSQLEDVHRSVLRYSMEANLKK
jgi:hypothetical protein